jgi:hypothetical protein
MDSGDSAPPPRRRRALRVALLAVGALVLLVVLGVVLLVVHFRSTPTFAEHLRAHPVAAAVLDEAGPGSVLGRDGAWRTGDVDPFALADDDPRHWRQTLRFTTALRHGDDLLLQLVQELAVAFDRQDGRRVGAACRTISSAKHPDMRFLARTVLSDVDRILESGGGTVTFDVLLGAGCGPGRTLALAAPSEALPALEPGDTPGLVASVLRRMVPGRVTAPEGVLHHVRTSCWLGWQSPAPGQWQSASHGEIVHAASTAEYSYEFTGELKDESSRGGGVSRSLHEDVRFSWNDAVW